MKNKKITQNSQEFGEFIAQKIVEFAQKTLAESPKFFIAVSGGTTPVPVFKTLGSKQIQKVLDWSNVDVFFIDERCVKPESADNNFQSCYTHWLKQVQEIRYHRINSSIDPDSAAQEYENEIVKTLPSRNGIPCFDLIFMGIGNDGHVASLFPDFDFEKEDKTLVKHVVVDSDIPERITMTIPLLNNAKNRIIGLVGELKIKIYSDLLASTNTNYPVSHLLSSNANDLWVLQ
mgnify:CR=1 FL=1